MNILIVDDETIISEWLQYTIRSFNFEQLNTSIASDGIEALQMVKSKIFDIIFIDIQMPRMNGLEFLQEIRSIGVDTYCIVLSSYNDFNYAREALRYGASEYILKSECSKELLFNLLSKYRLQRVQCPSKLDISYSDYLQLVINNKANTLSETLTNTLFSNFQDKTFYCLAIRDGTIDINALSTAFDNLKSNSYFLLLGTYSQTTYYLLTILDPQQLSILNILKDFACKYPQALIGSSQPFSSTPYIKDSILQVCDTLKDLFYNTESNYMVYKKSTFVEPTPHMNTLYISILQHIHKYNIAQLSSTILELSNCIKHNKPDISWVKNTYYNILYSLYLYNSENLDCLSSYLTDIKENVYTLNKLSDLVDYILLIIHQDILLLPKFNMYSPHIQSAITFISENYFSITSVSDVANAIHLNADYLTRLFKKEIGKNITTYLMEYKLNIAANMLRTTHLSISEIAIQVGIENISYFSKKFKERFNVQPLSYRNKNT